MYPKTKLNLCTLDGQAFTSERTHSHGYYFIFPTLPLPHIILVLVVSPGKLTFLGTHSLRLIRQSFYQQMLGKWFPLPSLFSFFFLFSLLLNSERSWASMILMLWLASAGQLPPHQPQNKCLKSPNTRCQPRGFHHSGVPGCHITSHRK